MSPVPRQAPEVCRTVSVIVPVYNGGAVWREAAAALSRAWKASRHHITIKVVDSSSRDDSAQVARESGFEVSTIDTAEFDHGGTRNAVASGEASEILVFLTQDAILDDAMALDRLLGAFEDPAVAVAYGRQLPHKNANPIAAHARAFNYPADSYVSGIEDAAVRGVKAVFSSNSFAAYRASVFRELGGFPERNIVSEDMYFTARAVMAGHKVAYVASACVRHSHNYSPLEELRRYFDIGVFQQNEGWIRATFGEVEGEGLRFVKSEYRYLFARAPLWIPRAFLHNALKMVGYRLGRHYCSLPAALLHWLTMHRGYWKV